MNTDYIDQIMASLSNRQMLSCIQLDDYSKPPFCSVTKPYFGTAQDLQEFKEFLAKESNSGCSEKPAITKFRILGIRSSVVHNYSHQHLNTWGWPYEIRSELVESVHVWLKHKKRCYRCLKAKLTGASYYCEASDTLHSLGGMIWGHPGVLDCSNGILLNRLYELEKAFTSEAAAMDDLQHFDGVPVLTEFLNDIFGDG